jgi:tetratricopeptide (TPR) repeat protein
MSLIENKNLPIFYQEKEITKNQLDQLKNVLRDGINFLDKYSRDNRISIESINVLISGTQSIIEQSLEEFENARNLIEQIFNFSISIQQILTQFSLTTAKNEDLVALSGEIISKAPLTQVMFLQTTINALEQLVSEVLALFNDLGEFVPFTGTGTNYLELEESVKQALFKLDELLKDAFDAIEDIDDWIEAYPTREEVLINKTLTSDTNTIYAKAITIKIKASNSIGKGDAVTVVNYEELTNSYVVIKTNNTNNFANGISMQTLANTEYGLMIVYGLFKGIDTSSYNANSVLYVNSTGGLTTTEPTEGFKQPIGFTLNSLSNGSILVTAGYPKQDAWDVAFDDSVTQLAGEEETVADVQTAIEKLNVVLKDYTDTKIANLIGDAPELLNTLSELAEALGNDEEFSVNLLQAISNIESDIGVLSSLATENQEDLVSAINELEGRIETNEDNIGDLTTLSSNDKSSIVAAINEIFANVVTDFEEILAVIEQVEENTTDITNIQTAIANIISGAQAIDYDSTNTGSLSETLQEVIDEIYLSLGTALNNITSLQTSVGTLTNLQTTNKTSLVLAINEVYTKTINDFNTLNNLFTNLNVDLNNHINNLSVHRVINDTGNSTTDLLSASEINSRLNTRALSVHGHLFKIVSDATDLTTVLFPQINDSVYQLDTAQYKVWNGTQWVAVASGFNDDITTTSASWSSAKIAAFIQSSINDLVAGASEQLNTLKEIADALNNDPNFYQTVITVLDAKVSDVPNDGKKYLRTKIDGVGVWEEPSQLNHLHRLISKQTFALPHLSSDWTYDSVNQFYYHIFEITLFEIGEADDFYGQFILENNQEKLAILEAGFYPNLEKISPTEVKIKSEALFATEGIEIEIVVYREDAPAVLINGGIGAFVFDQLVESTSTYGRLINYNTLKEVNEYVEASLEVIDQTLIEHRQDINTNETNINLLDGRLTTAESNVTTILNKNFITKETVNIPTTGWVAAGNFVKVTITFTNVLLSEDTFSLTPNITTTVLLNAVRDAIVVKIERVNNNSIDIFAVNAFGNVVPCELTILKNKV